MRASEVACGVALLIAVFLAGFFAAIELHQIDPPCRLNDPPCGEVDQ